MKKNWITSLLLVALIGLPTGVAGQGLDSLLIELGRRDQAVRRETATMITSQSLDTLLMAAARMEQVDTECRTTLYPLLDTLGWPAGLSAEANKAIWLIIQHDSEAQERYLPQMEQAAQRGAIDRGSYALLEDRINMNKRRPQRYGSQTVVLNIAGSGMEIMLWPVADAERLDSLRHTVGLQPIEKYLSLFESTYGRKAVWDPSITVEKMDSLRRGANTVQMKTNLKGN